MNPKFSHLPPKSPGIGIASIETYQPPWRLPNAWYASTIKRKFVKHTGITTRAISDEDEVSMARRCVGKLVSRGGVDLSDCAALILVSPSLLPMKVAHRYLSHAQARAEQPSRAAHRLATELGMSPGFTAGINGFCSGYAKALQLVMKKTPIIDLSREKFILVVTSSRISKITDYACDQSGALFGDFATVTLLARKDSRRYPMHFELLDADFAKQPAARPFFDFSRRLSVIAPASDGGKSFSPQRVVFSLDGMGIADTAPRAMANAAAQMARGLELSPADFQFIVPHQAGTAIVRLAGMKLEQAGFTGSVINDLTADTGNISSSSVPFALKTRWHQLTGNILCPVAAVGSPGKAEVSQGCIALRATAPRQAAAA